MSRRHPAQLRTPRQRREHLQRCIRCDIKLHGGTGSNITWYQRDARWHVAPLCSACSNAPP